MMSACKAQKPAPKLSNNQNLLAQVESIEADEAALLFQQAKSSAEKDKVTEARALIRQALGRGAGSNGMAEAEAEIQKAEARIAARIAEARREAEEKRKAEEEARRKKEAANSQNSQMSSSSERLSDTYCWSIKNENAKYACLNKPYVTKNEDARNILLGHCYNLSLNAERQGFSSVCARGKPSCYSLTNKDLHYPCTSCNGSTQWAATAVAGSVLQCF